MPEPIRRRDLFRFRARTPAPAAPGRSWPVLGPVVGSDLLKASRPGMGSVFEVRLPVNTPGGAELATRILDLIDELELQLTIYRDDSEVSRLNTLAHRHPVAVEPRLFDLIQQALSIHHDCQGAYDLAIGALSEAWGFVRGPKRVPSADLLADARARSGSHHLRLDPDARTVAFDQPGLTLNFGSIGKGYAIDRAADLVRAYWWPTSALIHGGRSSLIALGSPPDNFGGRWKIALANPLDPSEPIGLFHLRNRALGTSGAAYQWFEANGRRYGHILDPRTGEPPAQGPLSVTVLAPSAAEADAFSTAFYLLGPDAAASVIQKRPDLAALFLLGPDPEGNVQVVSLNLLDADFSRQGIPHPGAGR